MSSRFVPVTNKQIFSLNEAAVPPNTKKANRKFLNGFLKLFLYTTTTRDVIQMIYSRCFWSFLFCYGMGLINLFLDIPQLSYYTDVV